jgi:hypothetical protein
VNGLAHESQPAVAGQRARQQTGFDENLEAVADAGDEAALLRKAADGFEHRRKPRDRARPEVVAVGEAAGEQDHLAAE